MNTNNRTTTSPQTFARVAGLLYLLLVPLGIFGIQYIPTALIVPGDVTATVSNLAANVSLFRISIVCALLVQIINIFVVLLLYQLLKPVNKNLAVLMVIFLLLGVPIAMLNELNQVGVLLVLNGPNQSDALVSLFLGLHKYGILIAQIFWGLWLLPMGYLVFKSGFLPRILGVFLIIGGIGYLIDTLTYFLFPASAAAISPIVTIPAGIAELLFALWLLIKGVNVEKWEKRALESASV